jgi:hypothetical protein
MDSIIRNVGDLSSNERHVYESVFGQPLRDDQQVIVQLVEFCVSDRVAATPNGADGNLTPYAIWADLDDAEIGELESAILRRSDSRPISLSE